VGEKTIWCQMALLKVEIVLR